MTEGTNIETVTAEKLNVLLDWVGETTKSAQGFMLEQAPLVAQEIVAWTFWNGVTTSAACLVCAVALIVLVFKLKGTLKKSWDDNNPLVGIPLLLACIVSAICAPILLAQSVSYARWAIKAEVSPRLVIIEYVSKAVK